MRICLVAEGSYPSVTGGVSSWIQSLITNMPEHEFIIYAIGANQEERGNFKYKLPPNVVHVHEVFLDAYQSEEANWGKNYRLTASEKVAIQNLLDNNNPNWDDIFSLFSGDKLDSVSNFLTSKDFLDCIKQVCEEYHTQIPFNEFFWTVRSMLLPLFLLMREEIPEADVYHSVSTGYAGVIASFGKWKYNKPLLLTEHGIYTREREEEIIKSDWVKGHFKNLWTEYFYKLSHCTYHFSDQVISLFNKNKEIQVEIGCAEEKITIIPNGINPSDFENLAPKVEEDQEFINIGAIVRIVPIKDIVTMLQSFAIVKQEVKNARFFIFGPTEEDPEYYEECVQLVESLGINDVIFTGAVNIKEYVGKMDLLVLSSISEGQPLAVLEGLASKKPFVCTDVGSCSELLYGRNDGIGNAGIIVPVMNYVQMAKAIVTISKDETLRNEMGMNGFERVSRFYSRDHFINSYKEIYQKVEGSYGRDWVSIKENR
ncbi:GT4 family glycosyltransferase PelF [Bacillus sp. V5-8f]|uniref:GT4 family glycosyltransferase PelF n=1 Tax=Bacillus sp. V5-8f TaxID=2053044 RepID=UPI000C777A9E|nr:GT4 family glycosyltransferase PelF [Bacillus sp. V5-8f]PLT32605.1 glycosyl transferase [Bacillus sp. V5-8f]